MDQVEPQGMSFKHAVQAGIFTVPGDLNGCIDFQPILQVLADHFGPALPGVFDIVRQR